MPAVYRTQQPIASTYPAFFRTLLDLDPLCPAEMEECLDETFRDCASSERTS
jgi:hypothetical protein